MLIQNGADVNIVGSEGSTALTLASNKGKTHSSSCTLQVAFFKASFNNSSVVRNVYTLFSKATNNEQNILSGLDTVVKLLLEKRADPNVEEFFGGMTALMWALRRGKKQSVMCDF